MKQRNRMQYNAMYKFVGILDKTVISNPMCARGRLWNYTVSGHRISKCTRLDFGCRKSMLMTRSEAADLNWDRSWVGGGEGAVEFGGEEGIVLYQFWKFDVLFSF